MAQSFENKVKRLNGNWTEVVQFARTWGLEATMKEYDVKDSLTIENYLAKHAPGENFSYSMPEIDEITHPDFAERLLKGFLKNHDYMAEQLKEKDAVIAEQNSIIKDLTAQLHKDERARWERRRPLVEQVQNLGNAIN